MFSPEQQAVLDDLYWNSNRTIRSIAEQFGVTPTEVTNIVTPVDAGRSCWRCASPIVFRRRSDRAQADRRYAQVRCQCDAVQPQLSTNPDLVDTQATILLPMSRPRRMFEISGTLQEGVDALARCGLRWTGHFREVDVTAAPHDIVSSFSALPEKVVVVPALRYLATNTGDAMALFFRLVRDDWRVITSCHPGTGRFHPQADWYDEMVESW